MTAPSTAQSQVITNVLSTIIAAGIIWIAASQQQLADGFNDLKTAVRVHDYRIEQLEKKGVTP